MLLATLTARRSLRHPRKRQAEAVVENRGPLFRPSPPRRFNHNLYENDRLNSWQRLTGCPGWLLLFYLMRWAIACYFEKGSRLLNVPDEQKALSVFSSDAVTWNDGAQPPSRHRYQPLCLAFHVGCRLLHLWHVRSITWTPRHAARALRLGVLTRLQDMVDRTLSWAPCEDDDCVEDVALPTPSTRPL